MLVIGGIAALAFLLVTGPGLPIGPTVGAGIVLAFVVAVVFGVRY